MPSPSNRIVLKNESLKLVHVTHVLLNNNSGLLLRVSDDQKVIQFSYAVMLQEMSERKWIRKGGGGAKRI